jgi:flagellar protein FliO/FliZ
MRNLLLSLFIFATNALAQQPEAAAINAAVKEVAKETVKTPTNLPGLSQLVISLALVVGLVIVLAFLYKKMQLKLPGSKHFKIVSTLSLGPREKLLVIEIQGKQRVIGVTAHSVNFLFDLENPLPEEKLALDFHTQLQSFLKK